MSFPFSSQLDLQAPFAAATRLSQPNTHLCALQMDSISQFLELRPSSFKQQALQPDKQPQTDSKSDQQHPESLPTLEQSPLPARPPKKPSLFHNFQKHLITTICACVRLKPVLHHRRSVAGLAHQLWEYFVGQKRPSKRFLLSFLGRGKGDNKSSPEESGSCKEFQHLLRDFSEYSAGEVQEAQEYLCREITRQGRKIILQEQASIGRINRPKEFRLYFAKFIEELQHGEVRKRLPKLVKIELTNTNSDENE